MSCDIIYTYIIYIYICIYVYIYIYLSICLSIYLSKSIYLSIYPSIHIYIYIIYIYIYKHGREVRDMFVALLLLLLGKQCIYILHCLLSDCRSFMVNTENSPRLFKHFEKLYIAIYNDQEEF